MEKSLKIEPYELGRHYPELAEWWRAHGWKAPLPPKLSRLIGLVCSDDKTRHAAAWLYETSSSWAILEFLVVNPASPLRRRFEATKFVVSKVQEIAKAQGYDDVVTFTESSGLIRLYERLGFRVGDRNLTSLIWRVRP